MALTQQDVIDGLNAENADLATFGATLSRLFADVDKLANTPPSSPDFTQIVGSIQTNRAALGNLLKEVTDEDAKIAPPAPPAPTLSVSPTSISAAVGDAPTAISASASDGSVPAFVSSDAGVATVDASGNVTPVASGSCTISVTTPTVTTASTVSVVVA